MINPLKLIPSWRGRLIVGVVVVIIVGASLVGYRLWYNSLRFVSTDNAKVTVDLIQVGSVNAGRIIQMNVDVDTPVTEGQVIAVVDIPSVISRSDTTDTAKLGFRDVRDQFAEVVAPRAGVVAARWASVGDTVPPGQPIVTLMDQRKAWVVANIKEGEIGLVRRGQLVEVHVDSLGRTVLGRVESVSPVTAATFSLIPARNASGNFSKVSQLVPVKIILDNRLPLIPGSSVIVKIRVR
jgi:multidrug resistance efflux pump